MNLGNAIKLCRTRQDTKQVELAKRAGISVSYLSLLEKGKRDPNLSTVRSIASALNVPLFLLMFLADEEELFKVNPALAEKLSYAALKGS